MLSFEENWATFKNAIGDKHSRAYNLLDEHKDHWAWCYTQHYYCAGVSSTQRVESVHHVIKCMIDHALPMGTLLEKLRDVQRNMMLEDKMANAQHSNAVLQYPVCLFTPLFIWVCSCRT